MLSAGRLERIIIEHDPDDLFETGAREEEVDRDAIISEYAVSLSFFLADSFEPISVEVTPVANLPERRVRVVPEPPDGVASQRIRAAIEAAIDDHFQLGDFREAME